MAFLALSSCQSPAPESVVVSPTPAESPSPAQPSPTPEQAAAEGKMLDDFEGKGGINALGGSWYTYQSQSPAGNSQVIPPPGKFDYGTGGADGSGKAAKITGKVAKGGFITLGTSLDKSGNPVDLGQYKGIEFWAKGDGQEYGIQLQTPAAIADNNYYHAVFVARPEWTRYEIRFDEMTRFKQDTTNAAPIDEALKQVRTIDWYTHPYGQPRTTVELAIDNVKLIP